MCVLKLLVYAHTQNDSLSTFTVCIFRFNDMFFNKLEIEMSCLSWFLLFKVYAIKKRTYVLMYSMYL